VQWGIGGDQRTSNAYHFTDPSPAADRPNPPKANFQSGTPNQGFFSPIKGAMRVARGDSKAS
jgi:hypothetical protein